VCTASRVKSRKKRTFAKKTHSGSWGMKKTEPVHVPSDKKAQEARRVGGKYLNPCRKSLPAQGEKSRGHRSLNSEISGAK